MLEFLQKRKIDLSMKEKEDELIKNMLFDKKNKGRDPHFVLLTSIGSVYHKNGAFSHPVRPKIIKEVYKEIQREGLCAVL